MDVRIVKYVAESLPNSCMRIERPSSKKGEASEKKRSIIFFLLKAWASMNSDTYRATPPVIVQRERTSSFENLREWADSISLRSDAGKGLRLRCAVLRP